MLLSDEDTFAAGLLAVFAEASEIDACIWKDDAQPALVGTDITRVWLSVTADVGRGIDERRPTFDDDEKVTVLTSPPTVLDGAIILEAAGLRTVTLSVEVECWDQRPVLRARQILERIRIRLRGETALSALRAIDASLIDIGPSLLVNFPLDNRQYSKCVCEVRMHRAISELEAPANFIETIEVTPVWDRLNGEGPVADPPFTVDLADD